jgi:hypothetical protein
MFLHLILCNMISLIHAEYCCVYVYVDGVNEYVCEGKNIPIISQEMGNNKVTCIF